MRFHKDSEDLDKGPPCWFAEQLLMLVGFCLSSCLID